MEDILLPIPFCNFSCTGGALTSVQRLSSEPQRASPARSTEGGATNEPPSSQIERNFDDFEEISISEPPEVPRVRAFATRVLQLWKETCSGTVGAIATSEAPKAVQTKNWSQIWRKH